MSGLLSLSQYILVPIFSEWISDFDLCGLDSAVCHHAIRKRFLQLLSQCSIEDTFTFRKYYEELFDWLLLRGIGLKTVFIKGYCPPETSVKLRSLASRTKHLSLLKFDSFSNPIVRNLGLTVDVLKLDRVDQFKELFQLDLSFDALDASYYLALENEEFASIAHRFSNLKFLSVPGNIDVTSLLHGFGIEKFVCGLRNICKAGDPTRQCELQRVSSADAATISIGENFYRLTELEYDVSVGNDSVMFLCMHLDHLVKLSLHSSINHPTAVHAHLMSKISTKCFKLREFSAVGMILPENDLIGLFKHSTELKIVVLRGCNAVSDAVIRTLAQFCKQLELFDLDQRDISEEAVLELFSGCRNLMELDIGIDVVKEAVLLHVAQNRETIVLRSDPRRGTDFLQTVPRIKWTVTSSISRNGLNALFSLNPTLKKLDLFGIEEFNARTCERLVEVCPLLTCIAISQCTGVTRDCLGVLAKCKHLTSLSVEWLEIHSNVLEDLLKDKPNFIKLALPDCRLVHGSSNCFALIAKYCPILRHLDLTKCKELITDDVLHVLTHCRWLNYLKLVGCNKVSFAIFDILKTRKMRWNSRWMSTASEPQEMEHKWTNDVLISGLNKVQDISVRVTSCKDVLQRCITNGNLSDQLGTALGELVVCGAILSSTLKGEETMQYNVVGPNPGENMIVICDGEMSMRAKFGHKHPATASEYVNNQSMVKLFGAGGQFQCVRNHPVWKAPVPGATALRDASLATNVALFVAESEQRPAALMTAVKVVDQKVEYAIGTLIERMPSVVSENGTESGDENLEQIIANAEVMQRRGLHTYITTAASAASGSTDSSPIIPDFYVKNRTKVDINPDVTATLHHIMDEILRNPVTKEIEECGMRWFENPVFQCTCSLDKVWTSLSALSKEDLSSMAADGKGAEVRCDFCGTMYNVTSEEIGHKFQ